MAFAVDQTKSLLERLFVADARRRDLEVRFGTLARPSTKLRVEMDRSWHNPPAAAANSHSRTGGQPEEAVGTSKERGDKNVRLYGNVPPTIVAAPGNLFDRSYTPAEPVMNNAESFKKKRHQQHPSPRLCRVNVDFVPQKFVSEKEAVSMLSDEERLLLSQLSSHRHYFGRSGGGGRGGI